MRVRLESRHGGMHSVSRMALILGLLCGTAGIAHAQSAAGVVEDGATSEAAGEDIVVTAQFRQQNLQDTPLAITAVSGAMMEARSQTNLSQVALQAPSVTLLPQGQAFGPALGASIRGVGQFDFSPALEPGVGVYVDDVYYATLTGSILDLLDLDRVEILRGPQGTLSGRNSIGGAIRLYSKRPTGSNSGIVSATYGSRDRLDLRASLDVNLAPDLDLRLAGVSRSQRGYVERLDFGCVHPAGTSPLNPVGGVPRIKPAGSDCVLAHEGEVNYRAIRGQLRYQPTSAIDINIIADYTSDDRVVPGSVLLEAHAPDGTLVSPNFTNPLRPINPFSTAIPYDSRFLCGPYCNYSTFGSHAAPNPAAGIPSFLSLPGDGRSRFKGWGVSGQLDWELADNLNLTSITAYRQYESDFAIDNDLSPMSLYMAYGGVDFNFFSQELRLSGSIGERREIEYTLGAYYSDQKAVNFSAADLRYAGTQHTGRDPVPADSKAVFAHVSWSPVEDLTFNGGIRYTDESKDYTFNRYLLDGGAHPTNRHHGMTGHYAEQRVDYRLNVQYRWSNEIMTYAQFATGFKGGGINPRPFNPEQVLPFGSETLDTWEFGIKSDLFDRMMRLNLAGFYSNYDGVQLSLSSCPQFGGPGPCAVFANAGDARIWGFEAETTLRPTTGLLIDGSVSYVDFKYKSINPAAGGPAIPSGPQLDHVPPYAPAWKWSIGVQYELEMGSVGSLTPRFDLAYQDEMWTNAHNRASNHIAAYTLANARLTWRNEGGDLETSLEVTNLFDKYHLLTLFDLTIANAGMANAQPGRPREWAVTLKKRF